MDGASIPFLGDIDETGWKTRPLVNKESTTPDNLDITTKTTPITLDLTPLSLQEKSQCTQRRITPKRLFPKSPATQRRRLLSTKSSPLPSTIHLSSDYGTRICSRANWRQSEEVLRGSLRQYEPLPQRSRPTVPEPFVLQTALRAVSPPNATPESEKYVFRARPLPRFYGTPR